jgi:hypothetical protein
LRSIARTSPFVACVTVPEDIGSLDPYDRGDALEIAGRALAVEMAKRKVVPAVTTDEAEQAERSSSQPSSSPAARSSWR